MGMWMELVPFGQVWPNWVGIGIANWIAFRVSMREKFSHAPCSLVDKKVVDGPHLPPPSQL